MLKGLQSSERDNTPTSLYVASYAIIAFSFAMGVYAFCFDVRDNIRETPHKLETQVEQPREPMTDNFVSMDYRR